MLLINGDYLGKSQLNRPAGLGYDRWAFSQDAEPSSISCTLQSLKVHVFYNQLVSVS